MKFVTIVQLNELNGEEGAREIDPRSPQDWQTFESSRPKEARLLQGVGPGWARPVCRGRRGAEGGAAGGPVENPRLTFPGPAATTSMGPGRAQTGTPHLLPHQQ